MVLFSMALVGFAGYAMCAVSGWLQARFFWRYLGVFFASSGFFSCITIIITWTINNQHSETSRGTGMAILNVVGQCGPLLGTRLYPEADAPYYVRGMTVCASFMLFVAFLALVLRTMLARENRKLDVQINTGSRKDGFRYLI
jgi:MFS family permease